MTYQEFVDYNEEYGFQDSCTDRWRLRLWRWRLPTISYRERDSLMYLDYVDGKLTYMNPDEQRFRVDE